MFFFGGGAECKPWEELKKGPASMHKEGNNINIMLPLGLQKSCNSFNGFSTFHALVFPSSQGDIVTRI